MTKAVERTHSAIKRKRTIRFRYFSLVVGFLAFCFSISVVGYISQGLEQKVPYIPLVSEKLDYFALHKNKYDVLFIGSSRIYRQISPNDFDEFVSTKTRSFQSFNLGMFGMKLPETYFWLEKVLEMKPKNLKWVFVEVNLDNVYEPIANARTNRVIYWHDFKHTINTLHYIFSVKDTLPRKIASAYSHLLPFFYHSINLGDFSNALLASLDSSKTPDVDTYRQYLGKSLNGYKALDDETGEVYIQPRRVFLARLDDYSRQLNVLARQKTRKANVARGEKEILDRFQTLIETSGATPIFVIPPKLQREPALQKLREDGYPVTILAFNDPLKYENLYRPNLRFDEKHLNDKGAREFTLLLAQEFMNDLN
ncbi:MAG: hypothetical protein ACFCU8_15065 [Thermosynechococcaceae cyanobacterium]